MCLFHWYCRDIVAQAQISLLKNMAWLAIVGVDLAGRYLRAKADSKAVHSPHDDDDDCRASYFWRLMPKGSELTICCGKMCDVQLFIHLFILVCGHVRTMWWCDGLVCTK